MDGGRIVEAGKYDELMALNGYFAQLVRKQVL
jgi:ABC-type multidrug transport system fused ATPase/permease subunit